MDNNLIWKHEQKLTMLEGRNISNKPPIINIGIEDVVILIYTWVMYSAVCQIINIFGIVTNSINIICFVKQGFRDPVNISLLGLSVSDLGSLTTLILLDAILPCSLGLVDLPFESLDIAYMMSAAHFVFTRVSSCITAMITFEKCLSIATPLKIKGIVTPRRTTVAVIAIFVTFTLSAAPMYFTSKLSVYFSPRKNRTTYGIVYRDPRKQIEKVTILFNNFIVPFCAFIIIVICTIILVAQLRLKTVWRQECVHSEQAQRLTSRNQKIAKMVVLISILYIVCFVPSSVTMLAIAFEPALFMGGKFENISITLGGIMYALEAINSSMNVFIYHHMSSNYRKHFHKLFCQVKQ